MSILILLVMVNTEATGSVIPPHHTQPHLVVWSLSLAQIFHTGLIFGSTSDLHSHLKEQIQRAATEEKGAKGAGEEDIFRFLTDNVRRASLSFWQATSQRKSKQTMDIGQCTYSLH